jgi:hypothetical protein
MATAIAPAADGTARDDPLPQRAVPGSLLAEPLEHGEELHHELVEGGTILVLHHPGHQVWMEPEVDLTWVRQVLSKMATVQVDDRVPIGEPLLQIPENRRPHPFAVPDLVEGGMGFLVAIGPPWSLQPCDTHLEPRVPPRPENLLEVVIQAWLSLGVLQQAWLSRETDRATRGMEVSLSWS